jgi:methyl-accepting chemotaxis protein
MNLFSIYLIFFSLSTVVGVPLLSSFQVTQIKGSTWGDWGSNLGTTLGPAAGVFILVSIIVYNMLKPLAKLVKEAEQRALTQEEKIKAQKVLSRINTLSIVSILMGYPVGNGSTIIIKTLTGNLNYNIYDLIIILVLVLLYAMLAVSYSTKGFNIMAREQLAKLKIQSTDGMKTSKYTYSLSFIIINAMLIMGWHLFCSGYSAVRHGWSLALFTRKGLYALFISAVISIPLCILVLAQLRKRFNITVEQIDALRKKGDLATRLNIGTFDDFGKIMTSMNKLMDFLKGSLNTLKNESVSVGKAATDLLSITDNSSTSMDMIVNSFEEIKKQNQEKDQVLESAKNSIYKLNEDASKVSATMQEQAIAEEQNAESISQMAENTTHINELIQQAKQLSKNLSDSSEAGSSEVQKTELVINSVYEKSKKMSEVIQVIQQVASQTNLLAMNAAIEAAHAGDAGQGFAVVADEIRKLSETSSAQSKTIGAQLKSIQNAINLVVQATQHGVQDYANLSKEIRETDTLVQQIKAAMTEQQQGSTQILGALGEMNESTQLVQNASEEITTASQAIIGDVEILQNETKVMGQSMDEMGLSADKMQDAGLTLAGVSKTVEASIEEMGKQIDLFEGE